MNMLITNSKFNYNSRMGLTWGGGRGLNVFNCQFNYQGQGRFASKPYSGVDIEYEGGSNVGNMNGYFRNCKFKYNKYTGMICDAGSGRSPNGSRYYNPRDYFSRNFDFEFCDFVGSDGGVTCHPNSRNFDFHSCNFFGRTWKAFYSPVPGSTFNFDNTKFYDCLFSEEYTDPDIIPLTKNTSLYNPENKLTLFPNPATENIHINRATVGSEIIIYSILCEKVINWKVTEQDFEINIRNLKSGVYFIRTSDSKSYKFIKL